jgi:hypothetical protein
METDNDIERQIKELERDKHREEIKQLRADAKRHWITPTVLIAVLPVLGAFAWWFFDELKKYNEAYQALELKDALMKEKEDVRREKDSMNLEIMKMIHERNFYADDVQRMQGERVAMQNAVNEMYLRGTFAMAEMRYALRHIQEMGPPQDANLQQLRANAKQLPPESGRALDDVLQHYEFSRDIIGLSSEIISDFGNKLKLLPTSDWARALRSMPEGSVLSGRKIMVLQEGGQPTRYYDVDKGRFLTKEESEGAR